MTGHYVERPGGMVRMWGRRPPLLPPRSHDRRDPRLVAVWCLMTTSGVYVVSMMWCPPRHHRAKSMACGVVLCPNGRWPTENVLIWQVKLKGHRPYNDL
jgi:hypothetical protein